MLFSVCVELLHIVVPEILKHKRAIFQGGKWLSSTYFISLLLRDYAAQRIGIDV